MVWKTEAGVKVILAVPTASTTRIRNTAQLDEQVKFGELSNDPAAVYSEEF